MLQCGANVEGALGVICRDLALQMPREIHPLMQDPHDENADVGLLVKDDMGGASPLQISGADLVDTPPHARELGETLERVMQFKNVALRAGKPSLLTESRAIVAMSSSAFWDSA